MLIREGCKYNRSTTRVRRITAETVQDPRTPPLLLHPHHSLRPPLLFSFVHPHDKHGAKAHLPFAFDRDTIKTSSIVPTNARLSIRSLTIPTMNGNSYSSCFPRFLPIDHWLVILYHGYHRTAFDSYLFFFPFLFFFLSFFF